MFITLALVPLLVFGTWRTPGFSPRSLAIWLIDHYREDLLPAFFACGGAWLLFSERKARANLPATPDFRGLGGFLAMLAVYAAVRRLEMPGLGYLSLVGMGWFLALLLRGAPVCRKLATPGVWFVLATPGLLTPLTLPLRLATAGSVAWMLNLVGVPVEEHGTTIISSGRELWRFTVMDECSGTRTITTLMFVALMIAEGMPTRGAKTMLVFSAFPLGLGANILRTLSIGLVCHWQGEEVGMRFHQTLLAGASPLAFGLALLLVLAHVLKRQRPAR